MWLATNTLDEQTELHKLNNYYYYNTKQFGSEKIICKTDCNEKNIMKNMSTSWEAHILFFYTI